MSNFVETVREMLCDFCGETYLNETGAQCNDKDASQCIREITALEIVKLAKLIQDELDKKGKKTVRYR